MDSFTFTTMPKLVFGPGSCSQIGMNAFAFGRRALLVTGAGSLEQSGHLQRIVDQFEKFHMDVHHCSISGEPSPEMIDTSVREAKGKEIDVLIAVGGGSVLDAGKAIAAMLKEKGSVEQFLEGVGSKIASGQSVPVIAIPTTSGTGSEATKNAVLSRIGKNGFKKSLRHDNYIPKIAILDAQLCTTASPLVTAACGMDALTQLIESYVSTKASPLTDALSLDGLKHLIPALPDACGNGAEETDCRGEIAYGAFLSGVSLAHAGLGVVHGVAGPMGGLIAIPHGVACANLLPAAIAATVQNLRREDSAVSRIALEKFARIGRLFGSGHKSHFDSCRYLVDCLYRWLEQFGIPPLKSFGLKTGHVHRLVESASNKNNPVPLSDPQIHSMIMDRN